VRCFVAARPDPATRERLGRLASELQQRTPGGRRLRDELLHLTLAFIGELPQAQAHRASQAMQCLPVTPFDWRLDRVGYFEKAQIVWIAGAAREVAALAQRVRAELCTLDLPCDPRPFIAHVSLLRDVARSAAGRSPDRCAVSGPIEPIVWRIDRVELLVSERQPELGLRYRALHELD